MKLSLRVKVTLSIFVVLALSLIGMAWGLSSVMNERFSALEERETRTNASRIEEVLQNQFNLPSTKIPDWANWDDTFVYVTDRNKQYEETNLIAATLDNLAIDSMRLYTLNGDHVYSLDRDLTEKSINTKSALDDALKAYPEILSGTEAVEPIKGLIRGGGQIWAFAVQPIRKGSGEGAPSGMMIFARVVGEDTATRASELAKLTIRYQTVENAGDDVLRAKSEGTAIAAGNDSFKSEFFRIVDDNKLSIVAEAQDLQGNTVAFFSSELPREVMSEGRRTLSTLIFATTVGSLLTLTALLLVMSRFVISRLQQVSRDIDSIESGKNKNGKVAFQGGDEIGILSNTLNKLLVTIEERNASIREIVENVQSGFIMLNEAGVVQDGYTQYCDSLLGETGFSGKLFSEVMFATARERAHFSLMFEQVIQDFLPEELTLSQLPGQVEKNGKWINVQGTVVRSASGSVKTVLLTLTDITNLKKAEFEREQIAAAIKVIRSREVFASFIKEMPAMLKIMRESLGSEEGQARSRKTLHTVKGNLSMFGLTTVAREIHIIEDKKTLQVNDVDTVETLVKEFLVAQQDLLRIEWGKDNDDVRSLTSEELETLLTEIVGCNTLNDAKIKIKKFVSDAMKPKANDVLQPIIEAGKGLADRLGKRVKFEVDGGSLKVDHKRFSGVFDSLINAVRNSLDHGIEAPGDRGGKPEVGLFAIALVETQTHLKLTLRDDGRGVQFDKLCKALVKKGVTTEDAFNSLNEEMKMKFLLENTVSTAEEVSDISGRGLGLGGLRDEVLKVNGRMNISSKLNEGMCIEILLPLQDKNEHHMKFAA